jgi:DNA-binding NarL/FixJ family response regulator
MSSLPSDEYVRPPATPADLTSQQLAVAALIARAKPDKQIAGTLKITERQIRRHVTALAYLIHADPSCNTRIQIALWWREHAPITIADAA